MVQVYNVGLISGDLPQFLQGQNSGHTLANIFTSKTRGTIFNRIRQVAPTVQERATMTGTSEESQQL